MLDKHVVPIIKPVLAQGARALQARSISADTVTFFGFLIGICSIAFIAFDQLMLALLCLVLNRLADGLDGELARMNGPTDAGGFLDITLDFIFYAAFPLGFALLDPASNAVPAAFLIASFVGTGTSFLAFATQAEKQNIKSPQFSHKGLYYLDGLAEGTETIICFVLMCLLPEKFALIAWIFAALCVVTAANRVYSGHKTLSH